ncbi:hypothetical protein HRbin27_01717 [bacterium HR27]|nr:hypothetical protein HRbin27_01717 [bacterium HR27]
MLAPLERLLGGHRELTTVLAIPDRDTMPPPELSRDAPVANVFQPVEVDRAEPLRDELERPVACYLDGRLRERRHLDEPLLADHRLDDRTAALAVTQAVAVRCCPHQIALAVELLHHTPPRFLDRQPSKRPRVLVERPVGVEDVDRWQVVPLRDLEVGEVMGRRHLDRTRAERRIDRLIRDDPESPAEQRQDRRLADQMPVAFVVRMHRHPGVAEHRLRTRRRDDERLLTPLDRIAQEVKRPFELLVIDLEIGKRRHAARAPVDEPLAAVDQPLVVESLEGRANRPRGPRIHGEAETCPVARGTEDPELLADPAAVAVHPVPDSFEELLAPEVVPGEAFLEKFAFHDPLASDPSVVRSGEPQRRIALHPSPADHQVLDGDEQGVSHVQFAGHVRRRHDDDERLPAPVDLRREVTPLFPPVVPA